MNSIEPRYQKPKYSTPDVIIAEDQPQDWIAFADRLAWLAEQMRSGKLIAVLQGGSRGIIGPSIDGCILVDAELLLVPGEKSDETTPFR